MRQDYPQMSNTRIFLADADSTDRTIEVAKEYYPDLSISIIPGGLPSIGRNSGARRASSRYLLFLDADIELADSTLLRRAMETMTAKSLHCMTTDIWCRNGGWKDAMLYAGSNLAQRLSRLHKPFATGMFMLVEKAKFDEIGGFDERALYAEDYQLTQQFDRRRFRVIRGGIFSTNRRFRKMGHAKIVKFFITTALHRKEADYFRSDLHQTYWEAY
jgi:glycosyltransferase involved in cell wall biosynthesis